MSNFWDDLMETDEGAANYMSSYGEGVGFDTRHTIGQFIEDGETVLDMGCGPGLNADHFAEYGPKIHAYLGMDYSSRFIRVANERTKTLQIPTEVSEIMLIPSFKVGDIRNIEELDSSWDVVILQDCLEHTNGYEKPIQEALRVAKKRVIISFWHLEGNEGTEHINNDGNDGWGAWYDKTKWEEFLNSLDYVWHYLEVAPEGKTHKWDFYIIDLEKP